MTSDQLDALLALRDVMTRLPRQPEGTCPCCKAHVVAVNLYFDAGRFNRLREALFDVRSGQETT